MEVKKVFEEVLGENISTALAVHVYSPNIIKIPYEGDYLEVNMDLFDCSFEELFSLEHWFKVFDKTPNGVDTDSNGNWSLYVEFCGVYYELFNCYNGTALIISKPCSDDKEKVWCVSLEGGSKGYFYGDLQKLKHRKRPYSKDSKGAPEHFQMSSNPRPVEIFKSLEDFDMTFKFTKKKNEDGQDGCYLELYEKRRTTIRDSFLIGPHSFVLASKATIRTKEEGKEEIRQHSVLYQLISKMH